MAPRGGLEPPTNCLTAKEPGDSHSFALGTCCTGFDVTLLTHILFSFLVIKGRLHLIGGLGCVRLSVRRGQYPVRRQPHGTAPIARELSRKVIVPWGSSMSTFPGRCVKMDSMKAPVPTAYFRFILKLMIVVLVVVVPTSTPPRTQFPLACQLVPLRGL